jgi:hypothetical protein
MAMHLVHSSKKRCEVPSFKKLNDNVEFLGYGEKGLWDGMIFITNPTLLAVLFCLNPGQPLGQTTTGSH